MLTPLEDGDRIQNKHKYKVLHWCESSHIQREWLVRQKFYMEQNAFAV